MLSIQFGAALAKSLFPLIGTAAVTGLRLFFAAFILLVFWRPWRNRLTVKSYKAIFIYGFSLGMMNLLFYFALERIPLGIAVALEFIGPLLVSLIQSRKKFDFFWAFLAALGIYFILPASTLAVPLDKLGILYAFIAGLCWALYILFGKSAGQSEDMGAVTSLGMLVAAIVASPFVFLKTDFSLLSIQIIPIGIGIAVLSSALPYSLEMIVLKKIPTRSFGILMSLEPAIAAIMGYFSLKENLTHLQVFAIALIISASVGTAANFQKIKW